MAADGLADAWTTLSICPGLSLASFLLSSNLPQSIIQIAYNSCADLEGAWGPDIPLKNHEHIGFFLSNSGPDPLDKPRSYRASNKCWAIISTPAKWH